MFVSQEEDYQEDADWDTDGGVAIWTWAVIAALSIIVFGALIYLFYQTYKSCQKKRCEESLVTCYLCKRRVTQGQWKQGKHRQTCAEVHKETLKQMKSPENNKIRCPKCRARLRLWPANHGPPFTCSSSNCPIVGRIKSSGQNRFNCFTCNFDLCESCVYRKLGRSVMDREEEQSRRMVESHLNVRNSWYFGPPVGTMHGEPSAPKIDFQEEEPPPPYHQVVVESQVL